MRKCDVCNKNKAVHQVYGTNKKICNSCTGNYFVCTGCGTIYDQNDDKTFSYEDVCEIVASSNDFINEIVEQYINKKDQ